uniref:uncharacterized protein LOC120347529 n=1 Tax=Styela clava TaxID=7725 RepID=UPI00193A470D|nr:uncharacterized protein LOC120347529 [Styela clava]XP_039273481.1 uncharacterized protein LOC120347529 [Styela clava]
MNMHSIYALILVIIALCDYLNGAAPCTGCTTRTLGTQSVYISYGLSSEYSCNCDWTIPTSMDTDHETAVVLLLQNVSLPKTTGSGSIDCTGEIRFPSTATHKCDFPGNYCLAFATASTICNISKIREKIPVVNHTCDSIIPWNTAGGSPYEIQYYAKNFAGYTKYFTLKYLVIDCQNPTTAPKLTTTPIATTFSKLQSSTQTSLEETSIAGREKTTGEITNGITPKRQGQKSNDTSTPLTTKTESDSTTVIIIVVCIIVLLVIGIVILLILRYCKSKKTTPEEPIKLTQKKGSNRSSEKVMVDNILYSTADANSVPEKKEVNGNDDTDVAALYSVVQKNKTEPDGNRIVRENKDTVTVQEDPSCVYAVVQK